MTSLVGCAGEDFASILKSLGYVVDRRAGPAITVPLVPAPRLITPAHLRAERPRKPLRSDPPEETLRPRQRRGRRPRPSACDRALRGAGERSGPPCLPTSGTIRSGRSPLAAPGDEALRPPCRTRRLKLRQPCRRGRSRSGDGSAPEGGSRPQPNPRPWNRPPRNQPPWNRFGRPATAAAEPCEPVLIDVWRLDRRHHEARRRVRPGHARAPGPDVRRGTATAEAPARREPSARTRPRERPQASAAADAPADAIGIRSAARSVGDRAQPASAGARPAEPAPRGTGQTDDRRGPRPDQRPMTGARTRPERREKQPDPNSPFAKLLALKAQLEDAEDK